VRCVVDDPGGDAVGAAAAGPGATRPSNGYGSPGATGEVAARSVTRAARVAANPSDSSPRSGTSKYAGSATYAFRSANA
jgi:hypothetical protein